MMTIAGVTQANIPFSNWNEDMIDALVAAGVNVCSFTNVVYVHSFTNAVSYTGIAATPGHTQVRVITLVSANYCFYLPCLC
jgi:hypothetical protein